MQPPIEPTMGRIVLYTYKLQSHSFAMKEDVYNTAPAIIAGVLPQSLSLFLLCPYTRAVIVVECPVESYGYGPGEWYFPSHVESKARRGVMIDGK
jgi:hypothetical protein